MSNPFTQKSNYYERDWTKFNQEDFIPDYFDNNLADLLQIDQQNINLSMDSFFKQYELYIGCTYSFKKKLININ